MYETDLDGVIADYERGRLSRRQLIAHVTGFIAAAAAAPALGLAQDSATFSATDVNHIALRVTDVERSARFYQRHLGLAVTSQSSSSCFLRCSDRDFLALFRGASAGMDHYCFSVAGYAADGAMERLKGAGLEPRRQDQRVYFDDPDGLEVQVASGSLSE